MFPHKKVALSIICFVQLILAQDPIQGVVQNAETGAPIIGVNILLVGTETGTVSDVEGLFTLEKPEDIEPILRLSHIAYNTMELLIDSSYTGVVRLDPAVIKGQEIEVVGVKSKTEMDVASSVDMLDIAEIEIQGARDLGSASALFFETKALLIWTKSSRLRFMVGYKITYGEYPFGSHWQILPPKLPTLPGGWPLIDIQITW